MPSVDPVAVREKSDATPVLEATLRSGLQQRFEFIDGREKSKHGAPRQLSLKDRADNRVLAHRSYPGAEPPLAKRAPPGQPPERTP
jgi:hypothetical protein